MNEDEAIKRLLESRYIDVYPPQRLKATIMQTIEFIKTLKELCLLYSEASFTTLWNIEKEEV
jgi:hypothetical protein